MKRKIARYLFVASIILMGCSRENNDICRDIIEETSTLVSEEDAIVALQSFLSGFEPESKSGKHRVIKNVYSIGGPETKSAPMDSEGTRYYYQYNLKMNSDIYL